MQLRSWQDAGFLSVEKNQLINTIEVKQLPKERMIIQSQEHHATEIVAGCRLPECRKKSTPLSTLTTLTTEKLEKELCTEEEHA